MLSTSRVNDDSPETSLDATCEDSEGIQFRTLMRLLAEKKTMTDSEVMESLGPLATPGKIPEIIVHGLKALNTGREEPIDAATVLRWVGELCVSWDERLERLELVEIAIDCYSRAIAIAAPGVVDETHIR
ncbi:hypothetical protein FS749_009516, partial [Ceratobasidium sp. UAMH 11750]